MSSAPEFTTRDGKTYLLVSLPEVARRPTSEKPDGCWVFVMSDGADLSWGSDPSDESLRWEFEKGRAAAAVLHARQAERTPTPEETTVTDTPRTFANGDTIPDDVTCVQRVGGQRRWWRDDDGWHDGHGSRLMLDRSLLNGGPVTEVLP